MTINDDRIEYLTAQCNTHKRSLAYSNREREKQKRRIKKLLNALVVIKEGSRRDVLTYDEISIIAKRAGQT